MVPRSTEFEHLMTVGAGHLQKGDATNAINTYLEAEKLAPESIEVHLNLANSYLLAGETSKVIAECETALKLDRNSAAAYYLMGCAYLRAGQAEPAVQAFQQSQVIDPAVTALNFQLGLAQEKLGHLDEAAKEFETVVQYETNHPSAHYLLSRLYQRLGRAPEAEQEMAAHQKILAQNPRIPTGPSAFEQCKYTEPKMIFVLEQPAAAGVPVKFADATAGAFGPSSAQYHGPIGVLDFNHDGRNSLFVNARGQVHSAE